MLNSLSVKNKEKWLEVEIGKTLYALYCSIDKKMVLRNLRTDKREYISYPKIEEYVKYDVKVIEV